MSVSPGWKLTVIVTAAVGVVSTSLIWLLDSPDTGQLVGASVQTATGIAALLLALLQRPPASVPAPGDLAHRERLPTPRSPGRRAPRSQPAAAGATRTRATATDPVLRGW